MKIDGGRVGLIDMIERREGGRFRSTMFNKKYSMDMIERRGVGGFKALCSI